MKIITAVLALSLTGCFFVRRKQPATYSHSQSSTAQPKNHGQERSQQVHERNAEKKAAKDAEKGK